MQQREQQASISCSRSLKSSPNMVLTVRLNWFQPIYATQRHREEAGNQQGHSHMCSYSWLMKNKAFTTKQRFFYVPWRRHNTKLFAQWGPLRRKARYAPGHVNKNTIQHTWVRWGFSVLLKDTPAEYCLNAAPPGWMCKQSRLCSGWRGCEHLPEGSAALANTEPTLCTKARRSMQISHCGEDPTKLTAFHSWPTPTQ